MSFLSALGSAASPLLKSGGGYLLNKVASPMLSRISSYFASALGGGEKGSALGRTIMDRLYDTGVNQVYGGL